MKLNFYLFRTIIGKQNESKIYNPASPSSLTGLFIASLMLMIAVTVCKAQPISILYSTPGTYIWSCPAGITSATIECWGGGGSGGGAMTGPNDTAGGGGGGGAYVIDTMTVVPNAQYTLYVGTGADAVPGDNGLPGDSSWFISKNTVLAVGGAGGGSGASGVGGFGAGGAGGASSSCIPASNAISGIDGLNATNNGYAAGSGAGGAGAGPGGGQGGAGVGGVSGGTAQGALGLDGNAPGGGGSGGLAGYIIASTFGGYGAPGQVIITYNFSDPVINFRTDNGLNANAFPNPTKGNTTIQFNCANSSAYTIKLLDITGRELMNEKGKAKGGINIIDLDMGSYGKGIYMLRLESGSNSQIIKLLVE